MIRPVPVHLLEVGPAIVALDALIASARHDPSWRTGPLDGLSVSRQRVVLAHRELRDQSQALAWLDLTVDEGREALEEAIADLRQRAAWRGAKGVRKALVGRTIEESLVRLQQLPIPAGLEDAVERVLGRAEVLLADLRDQRCRELALREACRRFKLAERALEKRRAALPAGRATLEDGRVAA